MKQSREGAAGGPGLVLLDPGAVRGYVSKMPRESWRVSLVKRRYSVTADILSYRRCKRQYGFFARRGYVSAQSGQLFFGTVIHETLDRAHAHFRGELEGVERGSLPDAKDIANYFGIAEKALRARGIRPLSRESRDIALRYVLDFNAQHGRSVYPRVIDTEHRLQKDKGGYVLLGVVDVIAEAEEVDPESPGDWGRHEIWDYKGSKRPAGSGHELEDYEFQMRVYAHLYELRNGKRPRRAVLWFLGEKDIGRQRHEVSLADSEVGKAVKVFEETVARIEVSIAKDDWSRIRKEEAPSPETCDACDIRWNCPGPAKKYRIRAL